jgi:hypothetical protein
MALTVKIVTFSLDPKVIGKLEKLTDWMHTPNKSRILTLLIEKEYSRRLEERETT